MESDHQVPAKARTEDLFIFLALSVPIFGVSAALLTFIIVNAVTRH